MDSGLKRPVFAALIIGIDGWDQYTRPLAESLHFYEPDCRIVIIDNASVTSYPNFPNAHVHRTERLCYAKAINTAASLADDRDDVDYYIVLSNDVICTGSFIENLKDCPAKVFGPCFKQFGNIGYIEGWCVFSHRDIWEEIGGWDENYQISSWEDVDFTITAMEHNAQVAHVPNLPFSHLEQNQRFNLIPDYWDSETHNREYFFRKHSGGMQ